MYRPRRCRDYDESFLPAITPRISVTANTIRNRKKSALAISAEAVAMPPNPNSAAISAKTKTSETSAAWLVLQKRLNAGPQN